MKIQFMQLLVIIMTVANLFSTPDTNSMVHVSECEESTELSPCRSKMKGRLTSKSNDNDETQGSDNDQAFEIKDIQGNFVPYFFPLK